LALTEAAGPILPLLQSPSITKTQKSLAFFSFLVIMRALPQSRNSLRHFVHRFLTYLSRVCKPRLSKKLIKRFWVFPVSNDVLCAG
jgi:hypothetical protein